VTWLDLALVAGILVAVGAVTVLVVALRRDRTRGRAVELAARSEAEVLRERLDELERRLDRPDSQAGDGDAADFVITDVGTQAASASSPGPPAGTRIEGRLFADIVLRETVVKAAALAHGVRRATSPENRFRMRYEYSREVKRARKQRRLELRRLRRTAAAGRRQGREDAA
jgi:hypothetical protein